MNQQQHIKIAQEESFIDMNKGEIHESQNIKFVDVPVYTPNRDLLIERLNLEVKAEKPKENSFIFLDRTWNERDYLRT